MHPQIIRKTDAMDPAGLQPDVSLWQLKVLMRRLTRKQSQSFSLTDNETKLSAILASMRECRQTQVIHRYLFAKVKDLRFLLRLSHDIHQSLVATGLGKTAEHLGMARLLSWVLYDLAQELKRRRCSTVILGLHHACLEMKPRRNRARHAATANEALQRLLDHLNRAILQNIHDTKMILLITELTEPGDIA